MGANDQQQGNEARHEDMIWMVSHHTKLKYYPNHLEHGVSGWHIVILAG
jgi:hypothetical protein